MRWSRGMLPRKIFEFFASEIARNALIFKKTGTFTPSMEGISISDGQNTSYLPEEC